MLRVKNLNLEVQIKGASYKVINDISLKVNKNETLGLVGESGCGKSITALAIMGLFRKTIKLPSGNILFDL